ncbi:hypothetical protein [Desulfosarcina variabilis]|uniref:hypothetical protein n=1 Tax=Desulfosarcina variabilis TaxID=2300 RepID=UPI003AFB43F9
MKRSVFAKSCIILMTIVFFLAGCTSWPPSPPEGMVYDYKLIFDKFSQDDMMDIEECLEMFSGYISHRPDPAGMNTATHHEYIYKSRIGAAKLNRDIHSTLNKLNINGQMTISGRTYTVKKVGMPKDRS